MSDPAAATPAADDADDLGAALAANWDAQASDEESTTAEPADEPASPSGEPQPSASTSPEDKGGDAGRARDAQGRFAKAEQQAAAQAGEFKIPERWPAEVRAQLEAIHKVNPEHAKFVLDQYAFMRGEASRWMQSREKQFQGLAQIQKEVEDLLAPGRQQRALNNISDGAYIRNLIAAGEILDKNPREGLKWLAQRYGVNLSDLANPQAGGEPEIPPALRQVMQEQAQIKAALQQQYVGAQQARLSESVDWVNRFAEQTDAQGNRLYPHFDSVLDEIMTIVQHQIDSGRQVDVSAAYKTAIRMNDRVWLIESQRQTEASRKEAEAKAKRDAEEARRAGYSLSGSAARSTDAIPDDLGAHLARVYDQHS